MSKPSKQQCMMAIFAMGWVLFGYPLLSHMSTPGLLFGLPLLYLYIFSAWLLIVALLAWVCEGS